MDTNEAEPKTVNILLVEDDDVDVMGIERALKKLKIINPLVRARDGIEALEILNNPGAIDQPYIVLLDINMPRMNGMEFLAEVRKSKTLAKAVIFVLTTSDADKDKMTAYQHNVAGYILKQRAGDGFLRVMQMLDSYWRVVELPILRDGD